MSQIQIDKELFLDICEFFFSDDAPVGCEANYIREQLDAKIDKMISRDLFSRYKRMPTGAEREKARQEYLDHQLIPKSYRTDVEYHEPEPPDDYDG